LAWYVINLLLRLSQKLWEPSSYHIYCIQTQGSKDSLQWLWTG